MTPALDLLHRCRAAGITIRHAGDNLTVRPAKAITPELLIQIRTHKPAILAALEAEAANLSHDCVPWLYVAKQITAGEFDGGDRSLLDSLLIGVRSIKHPGCKQARARLETMMGRPRKEARP